MGSNPLLGHLPTYLQTYRELVQIAQGEQDEIDDLWEAKDGVLNNAFIDDADEYGVSRYEEMMSIVATPSETLDERKFAILTKVNEQLPYSMNALHALLITLCGEDGYTMTLTHEDYALDVVLSLAFKGKLGSVTALLERVVPCNLVTTTAILYNQHSTLANFTHTQLGRYSHYELRNEVVSNVN